MDCTGFLKRHWCEDGGKADHSLGGGQHHITGLEMEGAHVRQHIPHGCPLHCSAHYKSNIKKIKQI